MVNKCNDLGEVPGSQLKVSLSQKNNHTVWKKFTSSAIPFVFTYTSNSNIFKFWLKFFMQLYSDNLAHLNEAFQNIYLTHSIKRDKKSVLHSKATPNRHDFHSNKSCNNIKILKLSIHFRLYCQSRLFSPQIKIQPIFK